MWGEDWGDREGLKGIFSKYLLGGEEILIYVLTSSSRYLKHPFFILNDTIEIKCICTLSKCFVPLMRSEKSVIEYQRIFKQVLNDLNSKSDIDLTEEDASALLVHHYDEERVHEYIINIKAISYDKLKSILLKELKSNIGIVEFDSPTLTLFEVDNLEKATIKVNNRKWRIHKNDLDPFPSNPHAHEYENNWKLHLGTGEIFVKKKLKGKLNKKDFQRLRTSAIQKGIDLSHLSNKAGH